MPVDLRAEAFDPGDDPLEYKWDFGDGSPPQTGPDLRRVTHKYTSIAPVVVTLDVRDPDGLVATRKIPLGARGFNGTIGGTQNVGVNALPQEPDWPGVSTAVGPRYGANADGCLYTISFYDDATRTAINASFATEPGKGLETREYSFVSPIDGFGSMARTRQRDRQPGYREDARSLFLLQERWHAEPEQRQQRKYRRRHPR